MSQKVSPDKLENLTPPCGVTEVPQAERGLVSGRHRSRETTGTATPSPQGLRRALASTASDTALHLGEGRGQVGCSARPSGSGPEDRPRACRAPAGPRGLSAGGSEAGAERAGHTEPEGRTVDTDLWSTQSFSC